VVHHPAFAADYDLSSAPVNIIQFERNDFTCTQAESSKQE
jgi:hypothetical protein